MTSVRKQYDEYINSMRWRQKRQEFFRHSPGNRRCAGCGYAGTGLHVHHKTYVHLGQEPMEDLVAVCAQCHARVHEGIDSWSPLLSEHTDTVLAKIRRSKATQRQSAPRVAADVVRTRSLMIQVRDQNRAAVRADREARRLLHEDNVRKQRAAKLAKSRGKSKKAQKQAATVDIGQVRDRNAVVFERIRESQRAAASAPGKKLTKQQRAGELGRKKAAFREMERQRNEYYRRLREAS